MIQQYPQNSPKTGKNFIPHIMLLDYHLPKKLGSETILDWGNIFHQLSFTAVICEAQVFAHEEPDNPRQAEMGESGPMHKAIFSSNCVHQ